MKLHRYDLQHLIAGMYQAFSLNIINPGTPPISITQASLWRHKYVIITLGGYLPISSSSWSYLMNHGGADTYLSSHPGHFPGAPLTFNGAPGNIQGNLDMYADIIRKMLPMKRTM